MQILGKFEIFCQTFPPTPIHYDPPPPIDIFQKFSNPSQLFRSPYYYGRQSIKKEKENRAYLVGICSGRLGSCMAFCVSTVYACMNVLMSSCFWVYQHQIRSRMIPAHRTTTIDFFPPIFSIF